MYRDTMEHNNINELCGLNYFIKMLGINKIDIEHIFRNSSIINEQPNFLLGPGPPYPYSGAYYGVISLKDF